MKGYAFYSMERYGSAYNMIEQALELDPCNPEFIFKLQLLDKLIAGEIYMW